MKRGTRLPQNRRRVPRCRASIAILLLAFPTNSYSADKFWGNTSGGTFSTSSNWQSCGFFCTRVPGSSDVANFGLSDPSSRFQFVYTVNFSANATNQALVVEDDFVTFDFNGHTYTTTQSNQIGTQPGRTGQLTITDGTWNFPTNSEQLLDIGSVPGASGTLIVSAGGQISGVLPIIDVGEQGNGTLVVQNGGDVLAQHSFIGIESTGTATITGSGSTLIHTSDLRVGDGASGTMTISAGGLVQNTQGILATGTVAGTVIVRDFNSRWINTGELKVGFAGVGDLTIANGGRVDDSNAYLGFANGSQGTVTVGDSGSSIVVSQWINSGTLTVGNAGNGTLNIITNGHVQNSDAFVAPSAGSIGQINLNRPAAQWLNTGNLTVAQRGNGTVHITAGAVQNVNGTVGDESSSIGAVIVDGADSVWHNTGQLNVGNFGNGTLTIAAGANVSNGDAFVGQQAGSSGVVTVTGAGSIWLNGDLLSIGPSGTGTLTIANGGLVANDFGFVAAFENSTGAVTVTGTGSRWNSSAFLSVGGGGNGSLTIEARGRVTDAIAIIGDHQNLIGAATVTDAGSIWTTSGNFVAGFEGRADLVIQSGGSVSSNNSWIAGATTSTATATIMGGGSNWTIAGRLAISEAFDPVELGPGGGTGTLKIQSGGTVSVAQDTALFPGGTLRLEGGTLDTASVSFNGGGTFDWTSGTLHIGTYNGNLTNQGGTLAPGHSAGSTTIVGNYTQQAAGTIEVEIGGLAQGTQYDFVNVTGNALIDGKLKLLIISGFTPTPSQMFVIFDSNSLLGVFDNAGNGQRLATFDGGASFLVHYGVGSTFDPSQVVLTDFLAVALTGDYNQNGAVDAADYVVWRKNNGTTNTLPNDPFGGTIGQAQYNNWRAQFGQTAGGGSGATAGVPEPTTLVLLMLAATGCCLRRGRAA